MQSMWKKISFHFRFVFPSVAVLVVHVRYDSNPKTKSEGMALQTVWMRLEFSSFFFNFFV